MSDQDWYNSQGVQFEVDHNTLNQQISQTEQSVTSSQTVDSFEKKQVTASKYHNFGQQTLGGLTLIILTLCLQLVFLLLTALPSSDGGTSTIEDFENAMKLQFWFSIITIIAQLVGLKLIYNDARDLSYSLDEDVEVCNANLNILTKTLNRK